MFGLFGSKKKQQPERVTDEVLGELYYEAPTWHGGMKFKLFGETYVIDVEMISENDAPVTAAQKGSYKKILNNENIATEIEKVLLAQFPAEEFGRLEYRPMSVCFRPNGDCALIVYIGGEDEEHFGYAVTISPEISYYGDEAGYYTMAYYT
ncbi:MAG: hypothetical protein J6N70_06590 [Oribacterium sp.]|nr:hypothetical protein [Oribacterium sp.]